MSLALEPWIQLFCIATLKHVEMVEHLKQVDHLLIIWIICWSFMHFKDSSVDELHRSLGCTRHLAVQLEEASWCCWAVASDIPLARSPLASWQDVSRRLRLCRLAGRILWWFHGFSFFENLWANLAELTDKCCVALVGPLLIRLFVHPKSLHFRSSDRDSAAILASPLQV